MEQNGRPAMTGRGHRLVMDAPPEAGGRDEAPSPAELLLGAIGA